jgi:hypothetical protein
MCSKLTVNITFIATILQNSFLVWLKCDFKGIGSILFLKNGLKKLCRKNHKNHLRGNNYEVCSAVACCFPNILDILIIENIHLFKIKYSDHHCGLMKQTWISVISRLLRLSAVYISTTCYFHMYIYLEVFNFSEKISCFVLWTEFSSCQSTNLNRRWLDLFSNYHIQCVCSHSTALIVIFLLQCFILLHFWHIQNFINLDTMPLILPAICWELCFQEARSLIKKNI